MMCYMQAAKPSATASSAPKPTAGRQSLFSGAHIRGDGRFFFSADKKAAEDKAYELFQQLQDNDESPDDLEFEWRWSSNEPGFPNWQTVPVALQRIKVWFYACSDKLKAVNEDLLSKKCKKELHLWTNEFFELKTDLESWMSAHPNHKHPECPPAAKAPVPVQFVYYSSVLYSL